MISAAGIAIGTAALIIILSVYNGFEGIIKSLYSTYESDLLITPAIGKTFSPNTAQFQQVRDNQNIAEFCEIVEENVFVKYSNKEAVAEMKGRFQFRSYNSNQKIYKRGRVLSLSWRDSTSNNGAFNGFSPWA